MALEIDTLVRNKSIFNPSADLKTGDYGIWDLTNPSISYTGIDPSFKTLTMVPEYFQMRPDLIASLRMGNQNQVGTLLKFNAISNPFSLKEGQVLAVPERSTVELAFNSRKIQNQSRNGSNVNTNPNQTFRKNQEQKKFDVSSGRKKFLESKIKKTPGMVLPPNVSQPGDSSIEKKNGYLVLAPSAGGGGFNMPQNS